MHNNNQQQLEASYNFKLSQKKWKEYWQRLNIYQWQENSTRADNFVVDTPPPTVSGQLHIGHVYSYTQADFIVRFQRMIGKNVFYPIGFDDNGLPTERLIEKQRKVKAAQLGRDEFIKICKEVVADEEEKFRELFKDIALSVDWDLEYQTISPLSRRISQMSFLDLVAKNQVYRAVQPMLWDHVDQTALAQADVEDHDKISTMNDIVFHTENGQEIIVATTRPELLPACVAVFIHPEDKRYSALQRQYAITPLFNKKVPIYTDELVEPDKGTGIVMCCTFGDATDILWWKKHKLPLNIIISKEGRITNIEDSKFAPIFNGLKILQAREKILVILKEEGLLLKQTEITHSVKCAERSGTPLEILSTPQWFVKTIEHKEALLKRSIELNWHPKSMKIRLDNWINAISWDWCISRQRYFGVPFPVWYSKRAGEEGKIIYADISKLPVDPLYDLPAGYAREEVEADLDVMDTWATSSVSPQLASQAISERCYVDLERHQKLFPADLRPQAHEILRTWAFYTILKAHIHEQTLPWTDIMISGWCLAQDRSKMSKSKGNVIIPDKLLEEYGTDAVRYWAASSKLGADTAYSSDVLKNGKRLVNKLWNAAKFTSQHFDKVDLKCFTTAESFEYAKTNITHPLDQWLMNKLMEVNDKVHQLMVEYEYASAMNNIEHFFWSIFCDNYLEISKTRAYNENNIDPKGQLSVITTLYYSLRLILQLFAPFLPYITEEIFNIYRTPQLQSLHAKNSWIKLNKIVGFERHDLQVEILLAAINLVRSGKAAKNLSVKAPIKLLQIQSTPLAPELTQDLANVTNANAIEYVKKLEKNDMDSQLLQGEITTIIIHYE